MCGIICEICYSTSNLASVNVLKSIINRGPDGHCHLEINTDNGVKVFFSGAILWMQGTKPILQPLENSKGVLLYNGDIFDERLDKNINDTELIFEKLTEDNEEIEQTIISLIKSLKGPFSLIYYHRDTRDVYFTRDKLGRTSLLFHKNENSLIISSVLDRRHECIEVPATHICKLNIDTRKIELIPWTNGTIDNCQIDEWLETLQKLQSIPDEEFIFYTGLTSPLSTENDIIRYIDNTATESSCKLTVMKKLLEHSTIKETVNKISDLLKKSTEIRLEKQPNKCKNCLHNNSVCKDSAVGILFSGGLDCTILALLADKYVSKEQSIDLINVSFRKQSNASYDVPDRLTGRQSLEELKSLCPFRKWEFKEINVPKEELEKCQKTIIGDLIHPRQTILDESLGSALWFAARGKDTDTVSPCRVLLLGSGADELFGGYTRHRNAFKRCGWQGLDRELQLDWKRISFRNLARDNRVICDHGRQPRMPYLDEDVTKYVLKLESWLKCYPSEKLGPGIGDKLMLRLVAFNLGLTQVATFPKRALQFGSRIANKKTKGSNLSQALKSNNL